MNLIVRRLIYFSSNVSYSSLPVFLPTVRPSPLAPPLSRPPSLTRSLARRSFPTWATRRSGRRACRRRRTSPPSSSSSGSATWGTAGGTGRSSSSRSRSSAPSGTSSSPSSRRPAFGTSLSLPLSTSLLFPARAALTLGPASRTQLLCHLPLRDGHLPRHRPRPAAHGIDARERLEARRRLRPVELDRVRSLLSSTCESAQPLRLTPLSFPCRQCGPFLCVSLRPSRRSDLVADLPRFARSGTRLYPAHEGCVLPLSLARTVFLIPC